MKKILFMAMTPEGFIAKKDGSVDWSDDDWMNYAEICNEAGYLIIGRKTYDVMLADNEFEPLKLKRTIVITSNKLSNTENFQFCTSPAAAIKYLEEQKAKSVIIGGGSQLNSSMLNEKLIDEIHLDVEPRLFGDGLPLFSKQQSELRLELIDTFQSGENTVRLAYAVKYSD